MKPEQRSALEWAIEMTALRPQEGTDIMSIHHRVFCEMLEEMESGKRSNEDKEGI